MPIAWSGSGDVANFDVRVSRCPSNASVCTPWSISSSHTTSTSATLVGSYGNQYCFEARARNKYGGVSDWSSPRCTTIPFRSDQLGYSKGWTKVTRTGSFAGFGYLTRHTGAWVRRGDLVAKRVYIVATKCPSCGSVEIRWKGTRIKTLSLKSTTTLRNQAILVASFSTYSSGALGVVNKSSSSHPVLIEGIAAY
jgi:hypothetical protein